MESLKEKIYESVAPFVKKVVEIKPCLHKGVTEDDFFDGKFDGNWRLKVIPKNKIYIPNFIVVGGDALGKAVYTKRLGDKADMCTECYKVGHYRRECPGSRTWAEYCKEFKDTWDSLMTQVYNSNDNEIHTSEEESSMLYKLTKSEKEKTEILRKNEEEKRELNKNMSKKMEELKEMRIQKEFAEKQVASLNKELEKADKEVRKAKFFLCDR